MENSPGNSEESILSGTRSYERSVVAQLQEKSVDQKIRGGQGAAAPKTYYLFCASGTAAGGLKASLGHQTMMS